VTRVLVFERITKRYARFLDQERGTVVYIHIEDWTALGRPDRIEQENRPAVAAVPAQLAAAA
jgi:hypothetical protein